MVNFEEVEQGLGKEGATDVPTGQLAWQLNVQ